jgi:hypothetical protein
VPFCVLGAPARGMAPVLYLYPCPSLDAARAAVRSMCPTSTCHAMCALLSGHVHTLNACRMCRYPFRLCVVVLNVPLVIIATRGYEVRGCTSSVWHLVQQLQSGVSALSDSACFRTHTASMSTQLFSVHMQRPAIVTRRWLTSAHAPKRGLRPGLIMMFI